MRNFCHGDASFLIVIRVMVCAYLDCLEIEEGQEQHLLLYGVEAPSLLKNEVVIGLVLVRQKDFENNRVLFLFLLTDFQRPVASNLEGLGRARHCWPESNFARHVVVDFETR